MNLNNFFLRAPLVLLLALLGAARVEAATITLVSPPTSVTAGSTYTLTASYTGAVTNGIVQIQLVDTKPAAWVKVVDKWATVASGSGTISFSLTIPAGTVAGSGFAWQGMVYTSTWSKTADTLVSGVTVGSGGGASEWLPAGTWNLEWADEFTGTAGSTTDPKITKWYPMLGYTPDEFLSKSEKGLRWSGSTENTSWFYSTKVGNHWRDGQGNLVIRIVNDKTGPVNAHGTRVKSAYLLSGYPGSWDSSEPTGVKWVPGNGKFVSPKVNGVAKDMYISARVRTDQVKGYSTWFAFWLFSETRAYNNYPTDGTEVDVIEIAKGAPSYMLKSFNVANHWSQSGGSESQQFSSGTNPPSTSFVDVTDGNFHTYGIEWRATSTGKYMKCYVDGKLYKTFTNNIPTDPVDMMMLLTLEFQLNAWDPSQGDGRTSGPFYSDNSSTREMSRALVDYVRVYRKQ